MTDRNVQLYGVGGDSLYPARTRRVARSVSSSQQAAIARCAAVEAEEEVASDKLRAIGSLTRTAQLQAALVKQWAKNLELIAPEASADINHLGDTGTLLASEILIRGGQRIARL